MGVSVSSSNSSRVLLPMFDWARSNLTEMFDWARSNLTGPFEWARSSSRSSSVLLARVEGRPSLIATEEEVVVSIVRLLATGGLLLLLLLLWVWVGGW